jgi:ring-1,2-phenylacetyl-CoA epoxidase subunit PaaD
MTRADVLERLRTVHDPEIPDLSIVDLGMVAGVAVADDEVHITLKPTFIGCPALDWIRTDIEQAVGPLRAWVQYDMTSIWTTDDLTEDARSVLKAFGIAPPPNHNGRLQCPLCGGADTHQTSPFGSTLCRAMYYCQGCQQPFEAWKSI